VSGLEGTFLNASFSTANFLGLGRRCPLSAQTGSRTKNYQLALTEPYLFDRPITAGIDVYSRKIDYTTLNSVGQSTIGYSEVRTGASLTTGFPWGAAGSSAPSSTTRTRSSIPRVSRTSSTARPPRHGHGGADFAPFEEDGRHPESRIGPSLVYNTVDNPYTPRKGMRLTLSTLLAVGRWRRDQLLQAGRGGDSLHPAPAQDGPRPPRAGELDHALRKHHRTAVLPAVLPGGRDPDPRGQHPHRGPAQHQGQAIGGNKFILFNAEYYFDVYGPLRVLLFYDAGQAFAEAQNINLRQLRTSTGAELRFIMPVLNVPFRLIYAFNLSRDSFQPAHTFKFAVGTTF
jgi:outer membrane protein insertion porin family